MPPQVPVLLLKPAALLSSSLSHCASYDGSSQPGGMAGVMREGREDEVKDNEGEEEKVGTEMRGSHSVSIAAVSHMLSHTPDTHSSRLKLYTSDYNIMYSHSC